MDAVAVVALSLAAMGFIFGLTAFAQVEQIEKEVQRSRSRRTSTLE